MYIQDLPANQEQPEPRYFFPLLLAVGQVDGSSKTICILGGEEGMTAPGEEQERLGVPLSQRQKPTVPSESARRSSLFCLLTAPQGL